MRLQVENTPDIEDVDARLAVEDKIREGQSKTAFHYIRLCAIGLAAIIGAVIVVIYALHLILPNGALWLNDMQMSHIEKTALSIVTGVVSSFSIGYFLHKR